jgi:hypothetical protein
MPTPEARAAFAEATRLAAAFRDIHDRERAMISKLQAAQTAKEIDELDVELRALRPVATDLTAQYAAAVDRYLAALRIARGQA